MKIFFSFSDVACSTRVIDGYNSSFGGFSTEGFGSGGERQTRRYVRRSYL